MQKNPIEHIMMQRSCEISVFATQNARAACGVVVLLAAVAGCTAETSDGAQPNVRVHEMRDLAAVGDQESTDRLIEGLGDESESVRSAAQRGLEDVLKRRIYFDAGAPAADRNRALANVQAMWQNLQDRDLFEAVKRREPLNYFYDMNTGELFEARAGMTPIDTPSGSHEGMPAGVLAMVLACRDCDDDPYAAWLQAPVPELDRYSVGYDDAGVDGEPVKNYIAVRSPQGGNWALLGTPAAKAITSAALDCDNRPIPLYCRPGR